MEGEITLSKLLLLAAAVVALAIPVGASASTITQVMHGLDNPKGLAFGPEGGLYVAEGGRGGPASGQCWTSPRPDLGLRCYGATGAVSRYWHGTQARVVTGLPSLENPTFAGPAAGLSTSRSRDAAACTSRSASAVTRAPRTRSSQGSASRRF